MNFFKSVFSDPDPPSSPSDDDENDDDPHQQNQVHDRESPVSGPSWDFGGLIKTLATKSETVIQTYRRDLEEFGSGLKKETSVIREVAARAVRDLPTSLEVGASAAQESLESVGQAIDDLGGSVWRGTTEIIAHGKDAILALESESNASDQPSSEPGSGIEPSKRYSRFEAQVMAIQSDVKTFGEEPEDGEDFGKWKLGFDLGEKEEEIEILCYENSAVEGFIEKLVPGVVDYETFWLRYYYRVHKLKQAEDARAKLVKRVIDREEEEDLSWDVDDDDEAVVEQEKEEESKARDSGEISEVKREVVEEQVDEQVDVKGRDVVEDADEFVDKNIVVEEIITEKSDAGEVGVEKQEVLDPGKVENSQVPEVESASKSDDNVVHEDQNVAEKVSKTDDVPTSSSKASAQEEEDLEWDEIEDLGELEEKKPNDSNKSPDKVDLIKRLSAADEEDLSWDIEEDD